MGVVDAIAPDRRAQKREPGGAMRASTATNSNGRATPPASYSQPPIEGPTMMPKLVPDIT